jgi:integrase
LRRTEEVGTVKVPTPHLEGKRRESMATFRKRTTKTGAARWEAQVLIGIHPKTEKPTYRSKTLPRKADAERWAREQETSKDNGETPGLTRTTLAEWLEDWLKSHGPQVRDVTIYNYRTVVNRWILNPKNGAPPIGSTPLRKLGPASFEKLYRYMREQGIGDRGIRTLHEILRPALFDAVKKGHIGRNPVALATAPKINAKGEEEEEDAAEAHALTKEEAGRFLTAAREDRYSALWHVLLMGGLRPCEAMGLRWQDVDFERGAVEVRKSLSRVGVDREKFPLGWKLTEPKTKKSRRTVPLPDAAMRELRRWKKLQAWERRTFEGEYQDHGVVFTTEVGSPVDHGNLASRSWRRVMEEAGLGEWGPESKKPKSGPTRRRPFTPSHRIYDLRHTHATLLLMDGEDLLVVSRRLGHSTIKLTADTYGSVTPERADGAALRLDRMFA